MEKNIIFYFVLFFTLLISLCSSCKFEYVQTNESGVVFKRFKGGLEKDIIYHKGTHVILLWDRMIKYNTNIQEASENISVLSKDGKTHSVFYKYTFQCRYEWIGYLHEEIGENYLHNMLKPQMRTAIRETFGRYRTGEINLFDKSKLEKLVLDKAEPAILKKYIVLHSVFIETNPPTGGQDD